MKNDIRYLKDRDEILKMIESEISYSFKEYAYQGYTPWIILTALASVFWLFLNSVDQDVNIKICLAVFFFFWALEIIIKILDSKENGFYNLQKDRFLSINIDHLEMLIALISNLIFIYLMKTFLSENLPFFAYIPFYFFTAIIIIVHCLQFLINIIVNKNNHYCIAYITNKKIRISINLFLLLPLLWFFIGLIYFFKNYRLTDIGRDLLSIKIGMLLYVMYFLVLLYIKYRKPSKKFQHLLNFKYSLLFKKVRLNDIKDQFEIVLLGRKLPDAFQEEIDNVLKILDNFSAILFKTADLIKNSNKRKDKKDIHISLLNDLVNTINKKYKEIDILVKIFVYKMNILKKLNADLEEDVTNILKKLNIKIKVLERYSNYLEFQVSNIIKKEKNKC